MLRFAKHRIDVLEERWMILMYFCFKFMEVYTCQ